ncbi:hypothetical protein [Pedobacter sp. KACC 23697]|uniref:MukB N-terminal domain-containing protein n=1 Tax=Pedobacter sp. KACC 23697 TaxID=3149230 RepID=A0AAU7K1N3_9SPHI
MNYPSIYSLSTVGVIKHYIHDYLFHHKRTDFVGSNGVGKSIIADILQMMFIFDKDLIRFGTDGLKKEERHINTLPYKMKFAYCFLNVEVDQGKFILMGIQIQNQKNKRITPFLVTKTADTNQAIEHLAFGQSEMLLAKDFVNQGALPDLQELSKYFHEEMNLRLNFYRSKDDIQEYYRFLYEKHITPLNLTQEKSLKAFAKVIQSFSKAKSLNLSGSQASKNLKDFLFEDSDEDILTNYNKEQIELEKIIRDYDSLNSMICQLGEKQSRLIKLSDLSEEYDKLFKIARKAQVCEAHHRLRSHRQLEKQGLAEQKVHIKREETVKSIMQRLPAFQERIDRNYKKADEHLLAFGDYENLYSRSAELEEQIADLEAVAVPEIDESWAIETGTIDLGIRKVQDFKNAIGFAKHYLDKYNTLEKVEQSRKEQNEKIMEMRLKLTEQKTRKSSLLELLESGISDGIMSWFIKSKPTLSKQALQAVLYFAITPQREDLDNPEHPRYLDPKELFTNFEFKSSKKGIWVKLGALHEFIAHNPQADLLEDGQSLDESITLIIENLKVELSQINSDLSVLDDVQDGKEYDIRQFQIQFDHQLSESSRIERLKSSVSLILKTGEKISQLKTEKKIIDEELLNIRSEFKIDISEASALKKLLQIDRSRWEKRVRRCAEKKGAISEELKGLMLSIIRTKKEIAAITAQILIEQKEFEDMINEYYKEFSENIDDFGEHPIPANTAVENAEQAFELYRNAYQAIVHFFAETSENKNQHVKMEIDKKTFSFAVLERALLDKIKSKDDITVVLQEANQERTKIADGIRDSMIKIFGKTAERFQKYKLQTQRINTFFVNRKISGKFFFKLEFKENTQVSISYVEDMAYKVREVATTGELQFGKPITEFIEDFFKSIARMKEKMPIEKLLDPRTYFELAARLDDQYGVEVPGSTGETYSAIALLGVARLSAVQREERKGLRFIILEELGSLDEVNFNTFPAIAEEFKYQIITMAPHTFNIGFAEEWYAHHLIKGKGNGDINYAPSASYFKTNEFNEDLNLYIEKLAQ